MYMHGQVIMLTAANGDYNNINRNHYVRSDSRKRKKVHTQAYLHEQSMFLHVHTYVAALCGTA